MLTAVLTILVSFGIGLLVGGYVTIQLIAKAFCEGKWTRAEIMEFLGKWRGPRGERWESREMSYSRPANKEDDDWHL